MLVSCARNIYPRFYHAPRFIALLLIIALAVSHFFSCAGQQPDLEQMTPIAFAAAMTFYNGAWESDEDYLTGEFLWNAAGWYSAYQSRSGGSSVMTESEVAALQKKMGRAIPASLPPEWSEYGYLLITYNSDGEAVYDFFNHRQMFSDFFGQTMELQTSSDGANKLNVVFTWHNDDGSSDKTAYDVVFALTGGEWILSGIEFLSDDRDFSVPGSVDGSSDDGASDSIDSGVFNFTYSDLYNANSLENITTFFGSVTETYSGDDYFEESLFFYYNGMPASYTVSRGVETSYSGFYSGCYFVSNDAVPQIVYIDAGYNDSIDHYNAYLFDPYSEMVYVSEDDEYISFCYADDPLSRVLTVNKYTLLLHHSSVDYSGAGINTELSYSYSNEVSVPSCFSDWDGAMRYLRVITYTGGALTSDNMYYLPACWEYLPDELNYGYTAYLDEGFTLPYEYPGDTADYTLYLTDSVG